jgi:hypothetical protein
MFILLICYFMFNIFVHINFFRLELPSENVSDFALIRIFVNLIRDRVYDVIMIGNKGEIFRFVAMYID